jgi:hypothetical protein
MCECQPQWWKVETYMGYAVTAASPGLETTVPSVFHRCSYPLTGLFLMLGNGTLLAIGFFLKKFYITM